MLNPRALLALALALLMMPESAPLLQALVAQSKPGCTSRCGNLSIPYPFGTLDGRSDCYYHDGGRSSSFVIFCDNSTYPPVPYWSDKSSNLEVGSISIDNHEIRMMMFVAHDCYNSSGGRTTANSPWLRTHFFPISSAKNRFTVVGCDTYAYFRGQQNTIFSTGCMSICNNITDVTDGSCLGIGCCQASFPRNMKYYRISINSYYNHSHVHDFNPCGFAFVAENNYFNFSTKYLMNITEEKMPLVLDWSIGNQTCKVAQKNMTSYMCKENTNCINVDSDSGEAYRCHCQKGYKGNPYLAGQDGCRDINECETPNRCKGICTNLPGTYNCSCPSGFEGDPWKDNGCSPIDRKKFASRDIVLCASIGFLLLLLCTSWLLLWLRQRRVKEERKKFHNDNGGLMLESLLAQHRSRHVETFKVFSIEDLKKATDNFDGSRILGEGGQGMVYKGIVMNNKTVAIKKAKMLDRSHVDDFVNEIIVLHQINHKNVVKLIGCCLETELPLLVYEFVTNGTLSEHLHGNGRGSCLSSWGARLRIAAETAAALSYLHSEVTLPIVHRDVKCANILLDENYTAKVSDFGASRLMPSDKAQLTTLVQGTWGYLDPEYFHSGQLTEKSDVYSFGVVLAELLTGMKAISLTKPEMERNLSLVFVLAVKEDRCLEIIDKRILSGENAEEIKQVALLATRCLRIRGEERPSMKEVALELEGLIRASERHPWAREDLNNFPEREYLLGEIHDSGTGPLGVAGYYETTHTQLEPFDIEDGR